MKEGKGCFAFIALSCPLLTELLVLVLLTEKAAVTDLFHVDSAM